MNNEEYTKLRGGYYTPPEITNFLVEWAIENPDKLILEPCCGDGAFFDSLYTRIKTFGDNKKAQIYAIEIDESEYIKAKKKLEKYSNYIDNHIYQGDFFSVYEIIKNIGFDVILGNPPFIRYQNFDKEQREKAFEIMKKAGLSPTKLTNAWMAFLVASCMLIKEDGKLGMVIPAEILQVNYASKLRNFLANYFSNIEIITFNKLVFPKLQQEIVLLLADRQKKKSHKINIIELNDLNDLNLHKKEIIIEPKLKLVNPIFDKWTQYFLNNKEILILKKIKMDERLTKLGNLAKVDVGVVTGKNKFFVIDDTILDNYDLTDYCIPLVGRTANLRGINFTKKNWENPFISSGNKYLLDVPETDYKNLPKGLQKYITYGETQEFHKGYKCRLRKFWYSVPSIWVPNAFLTRQIHRYPKLVLNSYSTTPTDTIHRVKFNNTHGKEIVTSFLNSITFAISEINGRSYGGGVLEIEPNEAEELLVPYLDNIDYPFDEIDLMLKENISIDKILDIVDKITLIDELGYNENDISLIRGIWKKLSSRRINRNHKRT